MDIASNDATVTPRGAGGAVNQKIKQRTSLPPQHSKLRDEKVPLSPGDLPKLQTDTDTIRRSQLSPTPLYQNAAMPTPPDKPLPKDKPLPSRPVLSFPSSPSPGKGGRSLLDATDRPMAVRLGGSEHEWPALTPRSFSAPTTELSHGRAASKQSISQRSASASATTESVSGSEQASADTEQSYYIAASDREPESPLTEYSDDHQWRRHAERTGSLLPRASSSSLPRIAGAEHSRQLTPSPGSFSRLRPSSNTQGQSMRTSSIPIATTARSAKAQKTASRIPIPDSKKATLVQVKNRPPSENMPPASAHGLSFGARRLDVPGTIKILDHGVRRRQLSCRDSDRSFATAPLSIQGDDIPDTPTLVRSNATTPDAAVGASSSDEEEVVTPTFRATAFIPRSRRKNNSDSQNSARRLFEGTVDDLHRGPPPTSPFTGPLPTIPSQATLPPEAFPEFQRTSSFSELHERLSRLYGEYATESRSGQEVEAIVSENARASLLELLNEYTAQDKRQGTGSTESVSTLGPDARAHIGRALSMLEGNGEPANTNVSSDILYRVFGHLKCDEQNTGAQRNKPLTAEAAATTRTMTGPNDPGVLPPLDGISNETPVSTSHDDRGQQSSQITAPPSVNGAASKWSGSTASLEQQPLSSHPLSEMVQHDAASTGRRSAHSHQPTRGPLERPESIGYPSRTASKAALLLGPGSKGSLAIPHDSLHRTSSPTLSHELQGTSSPTPSHGLQGSFRNAKDNMQRSRRGFAAPTASAEAKKMNKVPTSRTKPFSLSGLDIRSHPPSADKIRSQSEGAARPKTPREQSKGRNMLSKINSMFSAKRDKKNGRAAPMLYPLNDDEIDARMPPRSTSTVMRNNYERHVVQAPRISPVLTPPKSPLTAKMPTISPPGQRDARTPSISPTQEVSAESSAPSGNATHDLCTSLIRKAKAEPQPARKERLLAFAKVLNDSLISAREAQLSAETAQHAAKSAQMAYEMTSKSVAMLQRLATGLTAKNACR
ncbi:hypothetical protein Tdes44962_MAKER03571 [Teratosphaeria destructans]|uniref:Uncharacterized protein n=1 Tax=Teratosphaeria destructans TaxID=418781 RepID=A0A9W7W165_9PEZI|nr:hypothetical protein Tdes44962_MAKER03571 [Teratosphaeria destructans]